MTMTNRVWVVAAVVGLASVADAQAQKPDIPKDMVPPPGMCRVWIRGVPAKQQAAPTDCKTATKSKPPNADVVYGDEVKKTPAPTKTVTSGGSGAGSTRGAAAQTATPPVVPPKRGGRGG
jgi:hypothetical protein